MFRLKNLGAVFAAALMTGLDIQFRQRMHRAVTIKRRSTNRFTPHQGAREIARRKRQIERGILRVN